MKTPVQPDIKFPAGLGDSDYDYVWKMYTHIREIENQFNSLQSTYRSLASTWLLATFGGTGFVLTETIEWVFDEALIIGFIGVAGSIGIVLLWLIDIMVYQRLLHAAFVTGVKLEERYPWLPPIRHIMMDSQIGGSVRYRVVWYYIAGAVMPLLIALISLTSWTYSFVASPAPGGTSVSGLQAAVPAVVVVAGLLGIVMVAREVYRRSTKPIDLEAYWS